MEIKEIILNSILKGLKDFKVDPNLGQRSVADYIESYCVEIIKNDYKDHFTAASGTKSTDDFKLTFDKEYLVDVKTHFIQKKDGFSMPNLITVDTLRKVLKNDDIEIIYLFVDYKREENGLVTIENIDVRYIWELDFSILQVGALGRGQLQIKNANKSLVFTNIGKKSWTSQLKELVKNYHKKQFLKLEKQQKIWLEF